MQENHIYKPKLAKGPNLLLERKKISKKSTSINQYIILNRS